jgi:hypothetical protein
MTREFELAVQVAMREATIAQLRGAMVDAANIAFEKGGDEKELRDQLSAIARHLSNALLETIPGISGTPDEASEKRRLELALAAADITGDEDLKRAKLPQLRLVEKDADT